MNADAGHKMAAAGAYQREKYSSCQAFAPPLLMLPVSAKTRHQSFSGSIMKTVLVMLPRLILMIDRTPFNLPCTASLSMGVLLFYGMLASAAPVGNIPYKELRLFSDIYANINQHYVEEVEATQIIEGAIRGMLRGLDPYSVYLTEDQYKNLKIGTTGKFGGLGIEISMDKGYIRVTAPIEGTPAYRAGILSGDLIVQIDDKSVDGMTLSEGVELMRGKVGTQVTLMISRGGRPPFAVTLTRAIIKRESIKNVLLDDNIAYVRISNFQVKTGQELRHALATMQQQIKGASFNGIILDLRSNPGGVLNEAIEVSDVFLDSQKLVVYTRGRTADSIHEYKTRNVQQYAEVPLVVMIDSRTASASEIVTGALKDHQRATVMGMKSFGKASVQTIHPIDKTRALKLTTARYYTPVGNMIHGTGIEPHIVIEPPHIEDMGAGAGSGTYNEVTDAETLIEKLKWMSFEDRVREDPQVLRALEELKTMTKTARIKTNVQ